MGQHYGVESFKSRHDPYLMGCPVLNSIPSRLSFSTSFSTTVEEAGSREYPSSEDRRSP